METLTLCAWWRNYFGEAFSDVKIAFVTNFCPHYRIKTFETLAQYYNTDYYFFSAGDEWYWQQQHGVKTGNFNYEYLPGFRIGNTRITPTLPLKLWSKNYDAYIKCINGRFALPITFLISRLKGKPFILWTGIWMRLRTPFHTLAWPLTRYIYHHADAIVVYGDHVKEYLIREGVARERIFVAAHAVDNVQYNQYVPEAERSATRERLGIETYHKVVLFLGRLEMIKGVSYLLEAFARLNRTDTVLVYAGDGSQKTYLQSRAAELGISSQVRFTGHVPIEKTLSLYAIADVAVLPSVTMPYGKELWGLVVNEAFNQGLPVIATSAVGAAAGGLIQHGVNGMIVPERNVQALTDALQHILNDPALRDHLSRNAITTISEWTNERMVLGFRQAIDYAITSAYATGAGV